MSIILNEDLSLGHTPTLESIKEANEESLQRMRMFAYTFNGYDYYKDQEDPTSAVQNLGNRVHGQFPDTGLEKLSLSELRPCLFYEARAMHHTSHVYAPKELVNDYTFALVKEIRKKIENR